MINFNSNDDEKWQRYLQEKESQEQGTAFFLLVLTHKTSPAIRRSNQEKANHDYIEEKERAETDLHESQAKQQQMKEFWAKTHQDLNQGALSDKSC